MLILIHILIFFHVIAGAYLLTQKDVFLDRSHITQLLAYILAGKDVNIRIDLPPPVIVKVSKLFSCLASGDDDDDDVGLVVVYDDHDVVVVVVGGGDGDDDDDVGLVVCDDDNDDDDGNDNDDDDDCDNDDDDNMIYR